MRNRFFVACALALAVCLTVTQNASAAITEAWATTWQANCGFGTYYSQVRYYHDSNGSQEKFRYIHIQTASGHDFHHVRVDDADSDAENWKRIADPIISSSRDIQVGGTGQIWHAPNGRVAVYIWSSITDASCRITLNGYGS